LLEQELQSFCRELLLADLLRSRHLGYRLRSYRGLLVHSLDALEELLNSGLRGNCALNLGKLVSQRNRLLGGIILNIKKRVRLRDHSRLLDSRCQKRVLS
jgi:hypothetical protein